MLKTPYLLFLGDAPDALAAKVAQGIKHWRPENCVGQYRLPGCNADCGVPDMSIGEAHEAGARTVVVGVANRGGVIADAWVEALSGALTAGLDVAAGLHSRLTDVPELRAAAESSGRALHDVRHPRERFTVGTGEPRSGKRVLAVGTDCSCGKMYATLALERELRQRGVAADFRATGQTGILITGDGVSVDAVVADFISGAVERIAPAADPEHWDVVEGQGSLFHPSFAGVSLGLLHGAQPDALILCHEPTRTHMRGLPGFALPGLEACMEANLSAARLTSPDVRFAGAAVNTSALDEDQARRCLDDVAARLGIPATDPFRFGSVPLADALLA